MNSFQDLNAYSAASTIEFDDLRPSNVLFDLATVPTPDPVNIFEGENHNVPYTINITDIINYQACSISYNINISSLPAGTVVEWPALPGYMTSSVDSGVYTVTGFKTPSDWTTVRSPVVNIPDDIAGTYVYPVSIVYITGATSNTKSWNVTVNITAVDEMSASTQFDFFASTTSTITGTPTIIDSDVAKTYTLTITPSVTASVTTLSSSGAGGTSTFNGSTKVLTLVGTKTQVNSHLAAISFVSSASLNDLTLTYLLTNNINAVTDTRTQSLRCLDILFLTNTRIPAVYYNEDTSRLITGGPLITDSSFDGSGAYTMTVTPSTTAAVSTMSATASSLAKTITNTGGVKVKTAQSQFGGASAYFPGLGTDLITVSNASAFNFSNNDFTVEFWIRPESGFPSGGIMNNIGSSAFGGHLGWSIAIQDYKVEFFYGSPTPNNYSPLVAVFKIGQSAQLNSASWSHIAFTCQNGTFRTFTNGVLTQTTSGLGQIAASPNPLQIGKGYYGSNGDGNNAGQWYETWNWISDPTQYTNGSFVGYLDEIRISRVARYTATFTPSASAFAGDNFNLLLIHANGANDSTAFTDDTTGQSLSGTASFNNSTKVLTLSGTRDGVNNLVDLISFTPATDYKQNFTLSYTVVTPRGGASTATKTQQMLIGATDVDITNMNVTRSYIANNANYIFAVSVPQIQDTDASNPQYTVSVSCSVTQGSFSTVRNPVLPASTNLSFTGTKEACNAWFPTVIFYPLKDFSASGLMTYTQTKNGTVQTTQQFSIIGSPGTQSEEGFVYGPNTIGAFSWTPTREQVYYVGVMQILLVGGGGGGGLGGGGGGGVRVYNNIAIGNQTYSGFVGGGGNPANYDFVTANYSISTAGGTSSFAGYSASGGGAGVKGAGAGGGYDPSASGNGGTSSSTTGTSRSGGTGYVSSTQRRGGGGASPVAAGTSASTNASLGTDRFGGAGAAAYTFDGLGYGAGGTGGFYDRVNNQAVSGSAGSSSAGGGGAGNIGGAAIGGSSGTLKTGLPLATAGANGRIKVWVRRV
jgi:hypothetical protein